MEAEQFAVVTAGILGGFNRSSQHVQFDWPASTGPELRREFSIRGLAGPCIERVSNNCEYVRTVCAQIGSFREVLSQQSIGVLVRSALPRAVRFAEVDGKAGCDKCDGGMPPDLRNHLEPILKLALESSRRTRRTTSSAVFSTRSSWSRTSARSPSMTQRLASRRTGIGTRTLLVSGTLLS